MIPHIIHSFRYGLNYKKHKLDRFLRRKPSFHTNPLVAFHLSSSEDNRKSKGDAINKVSPSKCSIERRFNVCKSRTLTFVRQCHVNDSKEEFSISFHLFSFICLFFTFSGLTILLFLSNSQEM